MHTMKKLLIVVLNLFLLVGITACSKEEQQKPSNSQILKGYVVERGSDTERGLDEYCFIINIDDLSLYYVGFDETCSLPNNTYVEIKYEDWVQLSDPAIMSGEEISKKEITLLSMYANMLDELMAKDAELGKEDAILSLNVDDNLGLTENEEVILGRILSSRYGFEEVMYMNYDELEENGYIKGVEEDMDNLPYFENGLLISITSKDGYNENGFTFNASKYKGGLAAYFFENCKASKKNGEWKYKIGSEAIS